MTEKRIPRPRDPLALAKLIGDIATGKVEDNNEDDKCANATNLGRLGGVARALSTPTSQSAKHLGYASIRRSAFRHVGS
jgi:hypothetical protein